MREPFCKTHVYLNPSTLRTYPASCKSWGCPDCVKRIRFKWITLLRRGTGHVVRWRLFTITNFPQDPQAAASAFTNTIRDIRVSYQFEYLRFNEIGKKTGMKHAHLLSHGDYIPVRFFGGRARANGLGSVDAEEAKGDVQGVELYITKYITKDPRTWSGRKLGYSKKFFNKPTSQIWSEFQEETFEDQEAVLMRKEDAQLVMAEPGSDLDPKERFTKSVLKEKLHQDKARTPWAVLPLITSGCPQTGERTYFVVCERCDYFDGIEPPKHKRADLAVRCIWTQGAGAPATEKV